MRTSKNVRSFVEPVEKFSFFANHENFRDARRQRKHPPPHTSLGHRIRRISQTARLTGNKVKIPVVALGGEKRLGALVGKFVSMVASNVQTKVVPSCGHFIPEECPEAVVEKSAQRRLSNRCGF